MNQQNGSVFYISYPMLPVSETSCGGAEQMLWLLERRMHGRGWNTTVAACEDSRIKGELLPTGSVPAQHDMYPQREEEHCRAILRALSFRSFDVIHDKSLGFWRHASKIDGPVLVTLHLPREFYGEEVFSHLPPNLFFNCVSESQAAWYRDIPRMLGVVRNGIALDMFPFSGQKSDYVLWLGRICPEKGTHLAIEAAERAGVRLVVAGSVYPFSSHRRYFDEEVKPRVHASRGRISLVESPAFAHKVELLRHARALLQPTLATETSSLVAMEAMACGTPVIAFRRGAIPEIVVHGETGFVVRNVADMVAAIRDIDHVWPAACRAHVEANFSAERMADDYEGLYAQVIAESVQSMRLAA